MQTMAKPTTGMSQKINNLHKAEAANRLFTNAVNQTKIPQWNSTDNNELCTYSPADEILTFDLLITKTNQFIFVPRHSTENPSMHTTDIAETRSRMDACKESHRHRCAVMEDMTM